MMLTPRLFSFVCLLAAAAAIAVLNTSNNLRLMIGSSPSSSATSSSLRLHVLGAASASTSDGQHLRRPANIAPGELPGYTGWARPERTSAGSFRIVGCTGCSSSSSWLPLGGGGGIELEQQTFVAMAGKEFYIDVRCSDCSGGAGSAEFYLRAYGPSVIIGIAKQMHVGIEEGRASDDGGRPTFRLSYFPLDAGSYTVEAVVAFTDPPPMEEFPLGDDGEEPGYEGYLLHGFPLRLEVLPSPASSEVDGALHVPVCDIDQLPVYMHTTNNGMADDFNVLTKGRWVVTERVRSFNYIDHTPSPFHASLEGYQNGYNSLGIKMEYQPVGCGLVDLSWYMYDNLDHWFDLGDRSDIHLIFVGDSVMGLQHRRIKSVVEQMATDGVQVNVRATSIGTHGGLAKRLDGVIDELQEIAKAKPGETRAVLFNAGLHDIAQLCSVKYQNERKAYLSLADEEFSCIEVYKVLLYKLTSFLASYPAEFVAFQTTSAGWMPYGNFGFAWNPNAYQPYSLSPNAVDHFNRVAKETVADASDGRFLIVDGYFITLARPDHREIGVDNAIGKHLVHPGVEVVDAMAKIWLTIVVNMLAKQ
jgi:hypothetical protein